MNINRKNVDDIESGLGTYLDGIRQYQLLTYDQELELSSRIEKGDSEALTLLINSNLRLVVRIAKSYVSSDMSLMDLIQEGNIGLMKAAEKYDYRKEVRFSTYASWWIKQGISRAISNKKRAIRLPHRKEDSLKRLHRISDEIIQVQNRQPSLSELANHSGMSEKEIDATLDLDKTIVSLDTEHNQDNGKLLDVIKDNSYSPEEQFVQKSMKEDTLRFLDILREKERNILMYRYALDGRKKETFKVIGSKMGISPETVRQIEIRALKKLRSNVNLIQDYYYAS